MAPSWINSDKYCLNDLPKKMLYIHIYTMIEEFHDFTRDDFTQIGRIS